MADSRPRILTEAALAWAFVMAVGAGLPRVPVLSAYSGLALAVALLYVPIALSLITRKRISFIDESWKEVAASIRTFVFVTVAVLGPAALVVWMVPWFSFVWRPDIGSFMLQQLVVVALPEEFFFRGYLQEKWKAVWPSQHRLFGASIGVFLILSALIFALSHSLITLQWWHPLIFFPGLVFGWLKEKAGTILAPVLFHTACNVFSYCVLINLP
jgi:membrane protease YdiL (CAAX protease family)